MWDSAGSVDSTCRLGAGIVHCSGVRNPGLAILIRG